MKIITREKEVAQLHEIATSDRPEFVAVYGRWRAEKQLAFKSVFKAV
jgi:AAA+ ATPase superfamily predicted ATPase